MSNLETDAALVECGDKVHTTENAQASGSVEVLTPRDVPLGGLRAMPVRRTLPQRARSFVGAWCFADHYGPDDVKTSGGMHVPPHPHVGLQTVSWLFSGTIEHRDSVGNHQIVQPGQMNLMTAGRGIAHSEVSTSDTTTLHGLQLWVALPDSDRATDPAFEHYVPEPISVSGASVTVFLGTLCGQTSPVRMFTPLLGAELTLEPGACIDLDVDPEFEHGLLVDSDTLILNGTELSGAELGFIGAGTARLTIENPTAAPVLAVLLGGTPFHEQVLMWWNFVARTDEEIRVCRAQWQFEIGASDGVERPEGSPQFGPVPGYGEGVIPAPIVPPLTLKPRRNPS